MGGHERLCKLVPSLGTKGYEFHDGYEFYDWFHGLWEFGFN